jgi:hypothetical protein
MTDYEYTLYLSQQPEVPQPIEEPSSDIDFGTPVKNPSEPPTEPAESPVEETGDSSE